jgi:hypothetical protein
LKRVLVHVGGFNLGLFMRTRFGIGTPRSLQGAIAALVIAVWTRLVDLWWDPRTSRISWPDASPTPQSGMVSK